MSEMQERVTDAIMGAFEHIPDKEYRRTIAGCWARAAIEAMRQPTEEMCEAGYSAGTGDWGGKYDNRRELACGRMSPGWQAMIDAALSR